MTSPLPSAALRTFKEEMIMPHLTGKRVLVIASTWGVEQDEIQQPSAQLHSSGAEVTIAAPDAGAIQSLVRDWDRGAEIPVDMTFADIADDDYDLLLIPGGVLNADHLRQNKDAQRIAQSFVATKRPIASICHGPWLLVETGNISGKQTTSYPSLRTDITNAGGYWQDAEVVRCDVDGWKLITSRGPQDLPAFIGAIEDELATQ